MFKALFKTIAVAGAVSAGYIGLQTPSEATVFKAGYAAIGNPTSVPFGWVDFCARYARECPDNDVSPMDINLTQQSMRIISRIDQFVNTSIEPLSDQQHWGVIDQWDIPTDGRGDCEDYALLKRKMLIEEGFPQQALLMTVVKDSRNEGHAVLTVKTNKGEFVLDNLNNEVKPWNASGYRFVKRQSQGNPNVWVTIGEPTSAPLTVSK